MGNLNSRLTQRGSPFELQDELMHDVPCKVFAKGPQTVGDVFRRCEHLSIQECIVWDDTRLTFGDLFSSARSLANSLRQVYGVTKGARVGIYMRNSPEWIVAFVAIVFVDAAAVLIHVDSPTLQISDALESTGCSVIICATQSNALLVQNRKCKAVLLSEGSASRLTSSGIAPLDEVCSAEPRRKPQYVQSYEARPDDIAMIAFSSGTTGRAKGIVLSNRNLMTGLMNMMLGSALAQERSMGAGKLVSRSAPVRACTLVFSALSHISGYSQMLLMLHLGGKLVLTQHENTTAALAIIERERVTAISGALMSTVNSIVDAGSASHDLSSLASFHVHGSALQSGVTEKIRARFPRARISTSYGMTETCGSICVAVGDDLINFPLSSGPILPTVQLKIMKGTDVEASPGEEGEIFIRGAMVTQGYCISPGKFATLADGWLRTGDVGRISSDCHLYVVGRVSEFLACGEDRISTSAIERSVCESGVVEEAVAVGFAKQVHDLRKILVIVIVPKVFSRNLDTALICGQVRVTLRNEILVKVIPYEILPRTPSGKVDRHTLRAHVVVTQRELTFDEDGQ